MPRNSAPISAPTTVPDPPARSVPPITAAAIALNRISLAPATSGWTEEARTASRIPDEAAGGGAEDEVADHHQPHPHPGLGGAELVRAHRHRVQAPAGERQHDLPARSRSRAPRSAPSRCPRRGLCANVETWLTVSVSTMCAAVDHVCDADRRARHSAPRRVRPARHGRRSDVSPSQREQHAERRHERADADDRGEEAVDEHRPPYSRPARSARSARSGIPATASL